MSAYDQLELLVAQAWERAVQTPSICTWARLMSCMAMHYPVMIVDVSERIRWMNQATLTLWRTLQRRGAQRAAPDVLGRDDSSDCPALGQYHQSAATAEFSRASFEQTLDTRCGDREFVDQRLAPPIPEAHATPCVALFLLDRTV